MLTVCIQAGGKSSRMGQDKALLPFLGQPLVSRVIERLTPLANEVILTTNHPDTYAFLRLPLYPDLIPDRGALGGLYTAMASAKNPLVAVVACDMPFASAELLEHARDILINDDVDVVIPQPAEGLFEPLHAIYRRETCLPHIKAAIAADKWKVISWFPHVKVRTLQAQEIAHFNRHGLVFSNVNTPEEFIQAEKVAKNIA